MAKAQKPQTAGRARTRTPVPRFRNGAEFDALSDEEKQRVSEYYDRHVPFAETRPLNAAERKQWERMKGKTGRPKKGEGAAAVRVTIERGLLRRADRYAETAGFTRSQLIAKGLEAVLAAGPR